MRTRTGEPSVQIAPLAASSEAVTCGLGRLVIGPAGKMGSNAPTRGSDGQDGDASGTHTLHYVPHAGRLDGGRHPESTITQQRYKQRWEAGRFAKASSRLCPHGEQSVHKCGASLRRRDAIRLNRRRALRFDRARSFRKAATHLSGSCSIRPGRAHEPATAKTLGPTIHLGSPRTPGFVRSPCCPLRAAPDVATPAMAFRLVGFP